MGYSRSLWLLAAGVAVAVSATMAGAQAVLPAGVKSFPFTPVEEWTVREAAFSERGQSLGLAAAGIFWVMDVRTGRLLPSNDSLKFTSSIFSKTGCMFVGMVTPSSAGLKATAEVIDGTTGRSRGEWRGPTPGKPWGGNPRADRPMAIDLVDLAPDASVFAASFTEFPLNNSRFEAAIRERLKLGEPMPHTMNMVLVGRPLTGEIVRVLDTPMSNRRITNADLPPTGDIMKSRIASLTFSPDGGRVAACVGNGTIIVWSVADGAVLRVFETGDSKPDIRPWTRAFFWLGDSDTVIAYPYHATFLQAGERLFLRCGINSGEVSEVRWRAPSAPLPARRDGLPTPEPGAGSRYTATLAGTPAFSPDGRYAAAFGSVRMNRGRTLGGIEVVDFEKGELIGIIKSPYMPVLAFSPDSGTLAVVAPSGTVTIIPTDRLLEMASEGFALPTPEERPTVRKPPPPSSEPPPRRRVVDPPRRPR